jgi:hypothetical protein
VILGWTSALGVAQPCAVRADPSFLRGGKVSLPLSVDTNHSGSVEKASGFTDDEETHRAAVRSAVAGDEAERAHIGENLEVARGADGLSRPKFDRHGHSQWIGIGRVVDTPVVDRIDPSSVSALRGASGRAEDS